MAAARKGHRDVGQQPCCAVLRTMVEGDLEKEDGGKAMKATTKDVVHMIREYREMLKRLRTETPLVETPKTERNCNVDCHRHVVAF